jgi:hypothetical protein
MKAAFADFFGVLLLTSPPAVELESAFETAALASGLELHATEDRVNDPIASSNDLDHSIREFTIRGGLWDTLHIP